MRKVIKQVTLVYVLTRRRTCDYSAVFKFLLLKLQLPKVILVVSDFERASFKAVQENLPAVKYSGCNFHRAQAVVKKLKDLGLYTSFCRDGPIKDAANYILTLPLLPSTKIRQVFYHWKPSVLSLPSLLPLLDYVQRNGIDGNCWKPERWSVYQKEVRTNNDAESQHRWWNNRGKGRS